MSTSKLTDQQVIQRLARREGYTDLYFSAYRGQTYGTPVGEPEGYGRETLPDYLNNHAALQRVLRLLTKPERKRLMENLFARSRLEPDWLNTWFFEEWLLLLPTADLARLVAEVLPS